MGKLLDLIIIDTRNYDRSITGLGYNEGYIPLIRDEASRSLMGPRQEKWFYRELSTSAKRGATCKPQSTPPYQAYIVLAYSS